MAPPTPHTATSILPALITKETKEESGRSSPQLSSRDSNGAPRIIKIKRRPRFVPPRLSFPLSLATFLSHDSSPPAMPSPLRNGDAPPPRLPSPAVGRHPFHSTVSEQKIRRLNALILLLRLASFCFCLAAATFMATNSSRSPGSPSWLRFNPFRLVLAANAIVALYSFSAMGFSIWEILKGATLFPEPFQLWFDFSHDQLFAYLLLAAEAAGAVKARELKGAHTCSSESAFCVQAYISVAFGFAGFVFVALSTLVSAFRVACYIITGSRFHL